jgi:hypothetical protein
MWCQRHGASRASAAHTTAPRSAGLAAHTSTRRSASIAASSCSSRSRATSRLGGVAADVAAAAAAAAAPPLSASRASPSAQPASSWGTDRSGAEYQRSVAPPRRRRWLQRPCCGGGGGWVVHSDAVKPSGARSRGGRQLTRRRWPGLGGNLRACSCASARSVCGAAAPSLARSRQPEGKRSESCEPCVQKGYSLSRGGCQNRRHSLVNCDHGDSMASRFDSPPRGLARPCRPAGRARRRGTACRHPPHPASRPTTTPDQRRCHPACTQVPAPAPAPARQPPSQPPKLT